MLTSEVEEGNLDSIELEGADESHQDLSGLTVCACTFTRVDFSSTLLCGTSIVDTLFEDCELSHADFSKAHLTRVRFAGCSLKGASFVEAQLKECTFTSCHSIWAMFS